MVKKFWKNFTMLCALVSLSVGAILLFPFFFPYDSEGYLAAYTDQQHLLVNTPSPKIIIIGGSNAAFGLDGAKIGKETGYNVVNTALQAGLGLEFMMEESKPFVHSGDIVLISPEYEQFGPAYTGSEWIAMLYVVDPHSIRYIASLRQAAKFLGQLLTIMGAERKELMVLMSEKPASCTTWIFCRNSFDMNGDLVGHLDMKSSGVPDRIIKFEEPSVTSIKGITDFSEFVSKRGAKLFLTFPTLAFAHFDANKKSAETTRAALAEIPGLTLLDKPEDFRYQDELFFDTEYHMNSTGREKRTNTVISELVANGIVATTTSVQLTR